MSRVPRIRFKGFEEDWEQRKLGEIGSVAMCRRVFKYQTTESGDIPFFKIGSFGATPDAFISRDLFEKLKMKYPYPEKGDVLISASGSIGRTVVFTGKDEYFQDSNIVWLKHDNSIINHFLKYLYSIVKWVGVEGTTIKRLYNDNILKTEVIIPTLSEQQKVSNYLDGLDRLITLHQRKLEKLKIIKKSMLENLFPQNGEKTPKIRFSGFTKDWEQRKWIDVVDISKNMVDPRNGKYDNLPHISPGNIESFTGQLYDNVKCVKDENLISGKFKFSSGDIIYGKINPQLGKYLYATFSGLTSADAYVLNAKNEVNQKYLYTIIQTRNFFEYSVSVSMRSGMPKINRDELNAYSFFAPLTEEQLKIGNCILKYDRLITLHQSKLEKLQKIKKSMLESMFV